MNEIAPDQNAQLKKLITTKLAVIDIANKQSAGTEKASRHSNELAGITQALYTMGYELRINVNPYYHENGEASTFTIEPLHPENPRQKIINDLEEKAIGTIMAEGFDRDDAETILEDWMHRKLKRMQAEKVTK